MIQPATWLAFFICVLGAIFYWLAGPTRPKLEKFGGWMFCIALAVFLYFWSLAHGFAR